MPLWPRRSRVPHYRTSKAAAPAAVDCAAHDTPSTSVLIHELLAVGQHTRKIGSWLAARETRPEEYLMLARAVVADLACGWELQSGGEGRAEDLLADGRIRMQPTEADTPAARDHIESTRIHGRYT
ncbi:hypothetical protein [Streptomyces violaceusniger]|uniref:Uncharacterized protein n=1 Tax=Streptomyces violaceusniger TaxID=68280 RepID=A0A4D4KJT7_STRVO|nr:hypothetical protein SVIO_000340 [Streptomyces violaceusniger]